MKTLLSMMIGVGLLLGTCAFAQEQKTEAPKTEKKKKSSKKKTSKKKEEAPK